jgi:two-component system, chemotaxis family, response regulator PixH
VVTVLVVEDTPAQRELICGYLREGGFQAIGAQNGEEGLEKFKQSQPQIVVTDLVMPGMSGLEMCRAIKKVAVDKVPVIACTTKNQELDRLWGMKQGIDVYLTKPFTKEELVQAVRSFAAGG